MKPRKIILLVACAVLLCICIIQAAMKNGDKVKNFNISEKPDEIAFTTPSESFNVIFENDTWFIGDKRYIGNNGIIDSLIEAASEIKALDKVGKNSSEASAIRYELNEGKVSIITLKKNGKVLRTLFIGKTSTGGSQTYITLDDSKDIYLVSGNLQSDIVKSTNDLRSKEIYTYKKDDITSVSITTYPTAENNFADEKTFTIGKIGNGEDAMWTISVPDVQVNAENAASYFGSITYLSTTKWYEDNEIPANGVKALTVNIYVGNKPFTLDIYNTYTDDGKSGTFYAKCSLTPYAFMIAGNVVNKYKKDLEYFVQ